MAQFYKRPWAELCFDGQSHGDIGAYHYLKAEKGKDAVPDHIDALSVGETTGDSDVNMLTWRSTRHTLRATREIPRSEARSWTFVARLGDFLHNSTTFMI